MSKISINGVEGNCIRPHRSSEPEAPLATKDNTNGWFSDNQACGWLPEGDSSAPAKCPINAGSNINVRWRHSFVTPETDIVEASHAGPCIAYLAKSDSSRGKVWFKIWEDGYDASTQKFCVDKLRENQGIMTIPIPSDLASGNYLLRVEIIALHEANRDGGAQPYVHCAELTINSVNGGSSVGPASLVAFPGAYSLADVKFDVYQSPKFTSYPIPGPAVYKSGSTGGSVTTTAKSTTTGNSATTGTPQTSNNNGGSTTASSGNTATTTGTCNIGSERCPCTTGGSCDKGLTCLSKICVNVGNANAASPSGSAAPLLALAGAAFAVFAAQM